MNDLQLFNVIDEGCAVCELIRDVDQNVIDFHFIEINPALERLLGVPRSNVAGHLASETYSNEYRDWIPTLESATKSGAPKRIEQYNRTTGRWFDIKASPINGDQVVVVFDEITERKKTEEAFHNRQIEELMNSNQRLNEVLASIQDVFYVLDRNWNFVYVNSYFTSRAGMESEDLIGNNIWKMFPKAMGTVLEENYRAAMEKREIRRFEVFGQYVNAWYINTVYPSAAGITIVATDITERKRVEEALRKNEERYRMLFDSMSEAFGLLDAVYDDNGSITDFRYLEVNPAAERAARLSREQMVGNCVRELFPLANPIVREAMVKAVETSIPSELEFYSSAVDRWQKARIWSPGKGLVVTLSNDITERKRAEEALRVSEERFRFTLANSPVVVANLDKDLRYTWIYNPARGFKPEDVVGKTVGIEIDPETTKQLRQSLTNVVTHGVSVRLELDLRTDTGIRSFETHAEPLRDALGEITGVSMLSIDITEIKRAEEERRKAEHRYRLVGDLVPFGVWESDVEGNATYLSPLFLELTELTLEEHRQAWQTLIHAEEIGSLVKAWRECVQSGTLWDREFSIRGKDGNYYAIHARGFPVHNSAGEITSYVGINFDVTDHRRVEEALRESERQLQTLNASLEGQVQEKTAQVRKLATDVTNAVQRERYRLSHILHDDIQQRIYAIHMQLTFLDKGLQKYSEETQKEAADIATQLLEVLEITRNLSIDLSPPILREEGLAQAITWLAHRMGQRYGLSIEIQADQSFPIQDEELHVFLFNCVREMLFNTVKHAEASHAMVALRWVDNCLEIKVQDDGKGFPAGQFDVQSEEERPSSSLGIPSIRQQLSLFGGTMEIESAPAIGTSILITVPIPERS